MAVCSQAVCIYKTEKEQVVIDAILVNLMYLIETAKTTDPTKDSQITRLDIKKDTDSRNEFSQIRFTLRGDKRTLCVFTNCGGDHAELGGGEGGRISCSIGASGENDLIIKAVAHALSQFGKTYVRLNDCSGDYVELLADETKFWNKKKNIVTKMRQANF